MRIRRGVSLVELLVVMSVCSTVLTTSAILLHRALQTQSQARAFFNAERSGLRLSDQFRRDVHQATAVLIDESPADVVLQLKLHETKSVEYRHHAGKVLRTTFTGGQFESREEFRFPPHIELRVCQLNSPPRVVMSITSVAAIPSGPNDGVPLPAHTTLANFQIEACVGRESQYVEATKDQGEPK